MDEKTLKMIAGGDPPPDPNPNSRSAWERSLIDESRVFPGPVQFDWQMRVIGIGSEEDGPRPAGLVVFQKESGLDLYVFTEELLEMFVGHCQAVLADLRSEATNAGLS